MTTIMKVEKESIELKVRRYQYKNRGYYDGTSKSWDDDTENEARKFGSDAEWSSSELVNKVENKRDRFRANSIRSRYESARRSDRYESRRRSSRYESRQRSPRYESRRLSPRYEYRRQSPGYESRQRSPRYESRRQSPRYEYRRQSPGYESRRRSPRYESRPPSPRYESRPPSPRYNRRSHSPSYDDRRSRSASTSRYEKGETDRKIDGNQREQSTRDSYSDSRGQQDRNFAAARDFLTNLLRTRILSVVSQPRDELMEGETAEPINVHKNFGESTSSNEEHSAHNLDVRSQLSTPTKSEFNKSYRPTSTVTSNELSSNHWTNEVAGIFDGEGSSNFNDQIEAQSINIEDKTSDKVHEEVTFDEVGFRPARPNFKTEENEEFAYKFTTYCPLSQCNSCNSSDIYNHISKPVPQPIPKESILPVLSLPRPRMLSIPQPGEMPIFQPGQLSPSTTGLQSTPRLVQPHQSRDPRLSRSSNRFNSPPTRTHHQTSPHPASHYQASPYSASSYQNPSINSRRLPTASYQSNKAPMTYGEHKRKQASVASTSGSVHYNKTMKPSNIVNESNNSISIPKMNFKIPKIPRGRVPSNTIQTIDDWDVPPEQLNVRGNTEPEGNVVNGEDDWGVTPESVKEQLNVRGNTEPKRNVVNGEDYKEDNGTNQSTHQQENNVATDSLSVDNPIMEVNAETDLKEANNPNNLVALIDIMRKLSEINTLAKVKELLQDCATDESATNKELSENVAANVAKTTKKRHKNELDRLNDDINEMFIRDGVLSANGRRTVTSVAKYVEATSDEDICNEGPKPASKSPMFDLAEPTNIQVSTPLQTQKPANKVPKLMKKSAKSLKKSKKASKETDKSIKKRIMPSELKNSSVEGKRSRDIAEGVDGPMPKKRKDTTPVTQTPVEKNNNVEWHSLKKVFGCRLCDKPCALSVVNHYVNFHPNAEVFTSRLAPEVVECLSNPALINKCEVIKRPAYPGGNPFYQFKQFCYFCNAYKCKAKKWWIEHMAVHTGYYQFECVDCKRKFACKPDNHKVRQGHRVERMSQPYFKKKVLKAYICKLCNYVRFTKCDIQKHLINEHEDDENITKKFKKVDFLTFKRKLKIRKANEDESDSDYSEGEGDIRVERLVKEELEKECESDDEIQKALESLEGED